MCCGVGCDGMGGAQSWGGDSAMLGVRKLKEAGPESKPRSPMPSFRFFPHFSFNRLFWMERTMGKQRQCSALTYLALNGAQARAETWLPFQALVCRRWQHSAASPPPAEQSKNRDEAPVRTRLSHRVLVYAATAVSWQGPERLNCFISLRFE